MVATCVVCDMTHKQYLMETRGENGLQISAIKAIVVVVIVVRLRLSCPKAGARSRTLIWEVRTGALVSVRKCELSIFTCHRFWLKVHLFATPNLSTAI